MITVYRPTAERWEDGWKKRKRRLRNVRCAEAVSATGVWLRPFFIEEKIIIVKDVPAEVCSDCGEAFTKSSVAGRLEAILTAVEGLQSEMSIISYKAA